MKIIFLYSARHENAGSVFMRVKQVTWFLKKRGIDAEYLPNTEDNLRIKNSVVVFSKHLSNIDVELIWQLKKNNCKCLYDPVDEKIDIRYLQNFDAILCSSFRQLHVLSFKNINVIPFLHHHDPRLCESKQKIKKHIGYFGETANIDLTVLGEISNLTDVIKINTKNANENTDWIFKASDYAFHLVDRKVRDIDGFKPFTKGFNAAASGAIPLLRKPSKHTDAHICLGDNYPYYLPESLDLNRKDCILDFLYGNQSIIKDIKWHLKQMKEYSSLTSTTKYLVKCNEYL